MEYVRLHDGSARPILAGLDPITAPSSLVFTTSDSNISIIIVD